MKKSLLALAVLGAVAGVAQAQSSVQVYGIIDAGINKKTDTTMNIGKRDNNRIGFKGVEDIGGGLKALFQLEIRFEPDTGATEAGATNRPLFQGQSRVGLQGDFGMVRIGRGLTAYQESSIAFEPFHGIPSASGFQADIMVAGYNSDPITGSGSPNRFPNAIFYNSPVVNGFQVNTTVATKEGTGGAAFIGRGTAAAPQYAANAEASANPFSVSGTYVAGPASAMLAYERNAIETKLWSAAGAVMANADLKLMASYARQDQNHTVANNSKTKSWVVGANYTMGQGKLLAGYGQKAPEGLVKNKEFSVGYEYSLSKRTYVYVDASNRKAATSVNFYQVGVNHAF